MRLTALLFSIFVTRALVFGQVDFYDNTQIQSIHIYFSQSNWDYRMDTAKAGADSFLTADSVIINGSKYLSVGVKYKGNSSYNVSQAKNPLHISLNENITQNYQGLVDIKLSNAHGDPSGIREVLAYHILSDYMVCPRANFVNVFINDTLVGLYTNVESISKDFLQKNFYSNNQAFFKCNPVGTPNPTTKSNLRYISADSSQYFGLYQMLSNNGWGNFLNLCNAATNNTSNLESLIDIDRSLWMLAFDNVFVNLDSYAGLFAQNYYLYQDNNGYFNPILWDLNMCFGSFPYLGAGNTSMGSLTNQNMIQLPVSAHSTDPYWPLIKSIYANPQYKKMYFAHIKTLMDEKLSTGTYLQDAQTFHDLIQSSALADTNDYFTDTEFTNSITTAVPYGSYTVPGIEGLMSNRLSYLSSTTELNQTQAQITNITCSSNSPSIGQTVTVTAHVSNATTVYFGSRASVFDHFVRQQMFDDGLHNDGAAGDQVFGFDFSMDHALLHYYIYAENGNIGRFEPQRAEYEYFTLMSNLNVPQTEDVKLNELLASNFNGMINDYGFRKDWLELYNNAGVAKSLYGLYLSDNHDLLNKYPFPLNGSVSAHATKVIWMDNALNSASYMHANFGLSSGGETIYLTNSNGVILDSISFPTQTDDISYGRCPDGTGTWNYLATPSFNASNCVVGINEVQSTSWSIYPNPFSNEMTIQSLNGEQLEDLRIVDVKGQLVWQGSSTASSHKISTESFPSGLYVIQINGQIAVKLIKF
ncbi:MAG: CotH kinase family protein [Flavobacteriales bacterium]